MARFITDRVYETMTGWRDKYDSICSAPLRVLQRSGLDAGHPANEFFTYWRSLNAGETPTRKQFSPQDVPSLLKWLMMFRRERDKELDIYLLYLQGNSAAELTDGLQQGKYLDEFTEAECFDTRREIFRTVIGTGQPAYANILVGAKKSDFIAEVNVGAFPFDASGDQKEVVMVPAPASLELRRLL